MSLPPVEIPLGAMRFNSDSQKLEYWNGSIWLQVHTFSPNLNGGARGVFFFGFQNSYPSSEPNVIDYITISTQGNAIDFGDMSGGTEYYGGACASSIRGIFFGGYTPSGPKNEIQFITFSSTGNSQDFGNLTAEAHYCPSGVSNNTRGIRCGGATTPTTSINVLDYVTIASEGNAVDFGDMIRERRFATSTNSPVRGFVSGGSDGPNVFSDSELITIATTGNSITFGDLQEHQNGNNGTICSSTRGIVGGGSNPTHHKDIKKFEMSSLGDHVEFGDLSAVRLFTGGCSDPVRGVFGGGILQPAATYLNIIEYINISTGGDAVDFGDRTITGSYLSAASNGHGGLG